MIQKKQHPIYKHLTVWSCGTKVYSTKSNKYLKIFKNTNGYYLTIVTTGQGQTKHYRVHRLVAETFLECPDPTLDVHHKDHDKSNNNVENLEWCTRGYNIKAAMDAGVNPQKGETHSASVMTEETVHEVCRLLQEGWRTIDICSHLGVAKHNVCEIKRGNNWSHIKKDYNIHVVRKERISKQKVHLICELLEQGLSDKDITQKLKLQRHIVPRVRRRETYKDISKDYVF